MIPYILLQKLLLHDCELMSVFFFFFFFGESWNLWTKNWFAITLCTYVHWGVLPSPFSIVVIERIQRIVKAETLVRDRNAITLARGSWLLTKFVTELGYTSIERLLRVIAHLLNSGSYWSYVEKSGQTFSTSALRQCNMLIRELYFARKFNLNEKRKFNRNFYYVSNTLIIFW